jgi:hypothetical protein
VDTLRLRKTSLISVVVLGAILIAARSWAWFAEGHEIVAIIAADDLTPTARSHVAQILDVPTDTGSVEKAMLLRQSDQTPSSARKIELPHGGITSISAFKILRLMHLCPNS